MPSLGASPIPFNLNSHARRVMRPLLLPVFPIFFGFVYPLFVFSFVPYTCPCLPLLIHVCFIFHSCDIFFFPVYFAAFCLSRTVRKLPAGFSWNLVAGYSIGQGKTSLKLRRYSPYRVSQNCFRFYECCEIWWTSVLSHALNLKILQMSVMFNSKEKK